MTEDRFSDLAAPASPAPSLEELAKYELTDLGNAMRLIRLNGGLVDEQTFAVDATHCTLLWLAGSGWIGFNGRFWDREFGEDVARRAGHVVARKVRGLYDYLPSVPTPKDFFKFADRCGSSGGTSAMLNQAQSYLAAKIDAFDRDPMALNCRNGTLKMTWRDGEFSFVLKKHNAADRITRMTSVDYDPDATAPQFLNTVAEAIPDEAERSAMHRAMGYGTTGYTHEQAFFLCQGRGRDGKSTVLDACRDTLGDYAAAGDVATFLDSIQRGGAGPSPDLVKLSGDVRLVILSEPPRGSKLNEGRLKAWTSGSPITARDLNAKPFDFRPIGKLVWECNAFPVARGDDDGIWRRIKTALFRHQVPEEKMDRRLPDKLREERAGILNWLVAGVGDWSAQGLNWPETFMKALDDYRKASSPFGDWLTERCVVGEAAKGHRELSGDLYKDFKQWFEDQGHEKPMSARSFGDALRDRQVLLAGKDRAGLKYRGPIRLKGPDELSRDRDAENAAADANDPAPSAGGLSFMASDEDLEDLIP